MDKPAIEATSVVKTLGGNQILKGISLNVSFGTLFALLGPNGAGKTTFIKAVLNLTAMDSGNILIRGLSSQDEKSRMNLAYLPEKFSFYPYYTVEGTLNFFASLAGVNKLARTELLEKATGKLDIQPLLKRKLKTLSKGQLQRVGLCKMLMGNIDLIILDEPFSGLDPIGIKDLKNLLLDLKAQGKTIFINSHILSEVEQICDEAAIMKNGEIAVQGKIKDITQKMNLEDLFYNLIKGQEQ